MENPLEKISSFLKSFGGGKDSGSILGIDIGSSSIKVVQLKKQKGVVVLETYGELALGPYSNLDVGRATNLSASELGQALTDILTEANTTTRSCGVSIPFSASLISVMTLPRVEQNKLSQMVPIEARKYIPVPISEVTLDWFVIPDESSKYLSKDEIAASAGKMNVLIVAIHNEILNKYRDVLKDANLSVSFYEIEIFSTIRASLSAGVEPVVVIDIGAASTKVYVVELGIVKVSHIINKGSQDITLALSRALEISVAKAESLKREKGISNESADEQANKAILLTLDYIFSEANKVLLNYQRKFNRSVSNVLFTGGGSVLKGLSEIAAQRFNTKVELADPFAKTQTPAFLENVLKEVGPEFAVAVGVALRKLQESE